ncbi:phosphoribosylformylglycinamidine synthase subunit PurL [Helicobacter sp. MIT 14-3879]|uniref:phosphoribosylformylglycinamidine synthase subunit PurL n=1 Tax=Helicobacter sp. MIT 14-3879 TaxID=2040649 RepID=UPI000E1F0607|nr:phosphoribosylformylglycinamidine synthase subunit PurL [Helicobacter sp. MIT 14-3879]RDU64771.1 phosphoribosylformylglycinamidine synthase subunit PurL [Helicobacter sp. MIT 14-3879]
MQNIDEILKNHKLSLQDYENIKIILKREPNLLEIGIFSAMWSEHCSYKSSKIYLSGFPTYAPWVIQGPGENAGVIDIGGNYAAVFKMESHNHPSFIEPYAGAATGVGGILRDIFTMGARPVASLNSIRFGDIRDKNQAKLHKYLLRRVVAGIGDYGNCMGIPTIGGESSFESCYNGNILVNAFNLGIVKKQNIFYAKASGVGNLIIYAGSKTGRDGLGGAVMSSDSFNKDSASLRPTVQVGDPFSEKLLLEACLEVFQKDLIVGIQDMGAAGLTSSSFEMASRASSKELRSGMIMHLDKVPMREEGMSPYELMLSESQERMLICAKSGKENEIIDIFNKWEVDVAVIGEVTQSGRMELFFNNELVADIPIAPLSDASPILHREVEKPTYLEELHSFNMQKSKKSQNEIFREILTSLEVCDKSFIYNQFDNTILNNTIIGCGKGDASVIRVRENGSFLSLNLYCNPRYCYLNPKEGAKIAVATAGRNCVTRGARPLSITDCLNFGNPENPNVMWQFKEVCEGIKEACEILKTPVVSGNVSLYNQTNDIDIYPTPSIGMVGIIENSIILDSAFKAKDNIIVLLGELKEEFGGSLMLKVLEGKVAGIPPSINLYKELALWNLICENSSFIKSAKSVKEGGIAISLAKMAILGGYGIEVQNNISKEIIFSESQSCICIEIKEEDLSMLNELSSKYNIPYQVIGKVGTKGSNINIDSIAITQSEAKDLYFNTFYNIMES